MRNLSACAPIWVFKTHGCKYCNLLRLHQGRIRVVDVVISQQMQNAMHQKMADMRLYRFIRFCRLARAGFPGNRDIAKLANLGLCRLGQIWFAARRFRRPLF